jgi:hypothetical protein
MILHVGERVYWGDPAIIYLEGHIIAVHEQDQTVIVHIERTTTHSAHLIGTEVPFSVDGVKPLAGESPSGTTTERVEERLPPPELTDDEKIRRAAAVAVHQQHGYRLEAEQEQALIEQVIQAINSDTAMRTKIVSSINEILKREH